MPIPVLPKATSFYRWLHSCSILSQDSLIGQWSLPYSEKSLKDSGSLILIGIKSRLQSKMMRTQIYEEAAFWLCELLGSSPGMWWKDPYNVWKAGEKMLLSYEVWSGREALAVRSLDNLTLLSPVLVCAWSYMQCRSLGWMGSPTLVCASRWHFKTLNSFGNCP